MREERRKLGRRGATAAIVAVSLAALLGMIALAVDLGMLVKERSDAQRAADAGALAGAQEFRDNSDAFAAKGPAALKALEYASRNYVGWEYVDTSAAIFTDSGNTRIANAPQAYVQAIADSQKVRVFVRPRPVSTLFGSLFRIPYVAITVKAAAQAVNAGSGKCVKPFAVPDIWGDADNDTDPRNPLNRLPDIAGQQGGGAKGEEWAFDPSAGDRYSRYQDPNNPNSGQWTGYGSSYRNNSNDWYADDNSTPHKLYWDDFGRPITIKMSNPQDSPSPGFFYPWTMPYDSSNPGAYGGQAPNNGANWYKWNISNCNPVSVAIGAPAELDTAYLDKPGNMIGPTNQGIKALVDDDPLACWYEFPDPAHSGYMTGEVRKRLTAGGPCDQAYSSWESSPRVMMVPLFDPTQIRSGRTSLSFNNLALLFLEGQDNAHATVYGRFMFFAKSTGPLAPYTGSLIKKLQLVE